MRATLCTFVAATSLLACGPASRNGSGDDDDGTGPDAMDPGPNNDGCSDNAKLIYVVDQNNTLSQYDPVAKAYHDLGKLNCPAQSGATPFSMGISRTATAWVLYSSGELFHVDTQSLACTKSSWASSNNLRQFGMGFSTNEAGGSEDTLFIAGGPTADPTTTMTAKLAKLDTTSFSSTPLGTVNGWPELTGNANAELWGFFPSSSGTKVSKLDKTTGAALQTFPLNDLAGEPTAWAFAFYGGDYYIFLAKDLETFTTVYQMDGMTGQIKAHTPSSGRTIVGAGVSTCAPVIIN